LLAIVKHISTLPIPESVHTDDPTAAQNAPAPAQGILPPPPPTTASAQISSQSADHTLTATDYTKHLSDTSILMIGSLAQLPGDILKTQNLIRTDLPGLNIPYQTFIIRTAGLNKANTSLPEGLRWGEVRPQDYALFKSRTAIPKKDKTLSLLPSLAVFPTDSDTPIAWAFLGPDGSLATLHTEHDYRGRGLAKAVTAKLFNEKRKLFDEEEGKEEGGWLGHANVAIDNVQSSAVAKSLGGVPGWIVYWVRVDLGKFGDV
jgi:hypothetical protein